MDRSGNRGTRSYAAVGGRLIHPMLVVFPIAFLVGVLATDLAFWGTDDHFWALASKWLLAAGVIWAPSRRIRIDRVHYHTPRPLTGGRLGLFLGECGCDTDRTRESLVSSESDPGAVVIPFGIILSAVVVVSLPRHGLAGGELVFRHRIGIIDNTNESD